MGGVAGVLARQVVVVTGGGGGIGRALCIGFANDGATVVAVGHRERTLAETVALCEGSTSYVCADLSHPDECFRAMQRIIDEKGRIDVLVNNAGIAAVGPFLETPFETWASVIALNCLGPAACAHAVLPSMIRQGKGRIVTITSRAADAPIPRMSAYSASKAAVSAFTSAVAAEITGDHANVLINDLIPGPTRTSMTAGGQDPEVVYPYVRDLVLLPAGGPSGKVFFRGEPFDLFHRR